MSVRIKIHDVLHDRWKDADVAQTRQYIKSYVTHDSVERIRLAKGYRNTPIYITLDTSAITMRSIKQICRKVVRAFSKRVDGVDVDRTINDRNIKMIS